MSGRADWESVAPAEAVSRLAACGLLSERQAEAYVLREIEAIPRPEAADRMEISVNTLDSRLAEARQKVESAEATIEEIEAIRHRPLPDECADCGATLGGRWSESGAGEAICLDCAGIDRDGLG